MMNNLTIPALMERQPRFDPTQAQEDLGFRKIIPAIMVGTLATAALVGVATQEAYATEAPPSVTTTVTTKIDGWSVNVESLARTTEGSVGRITVLGNILPNGTPKKQVRKAEREGDCRTINGRKTELYTAGWNTRGGISYGRDERISRFCYINGRLIRVNCGNAAYIKKTPKPPVKGRVIWVQNMNKATLLVSANAQAIARDECRTPDGNASAGAYGEGKGSASARVNLKSLYTARSGAENPRSVYARISSEATVKATADATAKAKANCASTTTTTVVTVTKNNPTPQPPLLNSPPIVEFTGPEHMFIRGEAQLCASVTDPNGVEDINPDSRRFISLGSGKMSEVVESRGTSKFCQKLESGFFPGTAVVFATAADRGGLEATSDTESWPILDDSQGGPGSF